MYIFSTTEYGPFLNIKRICNLIHMFFLISLDTRNYEVSFLKEKTFYLKVY